MSTKVIVIIVVIFVLLLIGGGITFYFLYYKPKSESGSAVTTSKADMDTIVTSTIGSSGSIEKARLSKLPSGTSNTTNANQTEAYAAISVAVKAAKDAIAASVTAANSAIDKVYVPPKTTGDADKKLVSDYAAIKIAAIDTQAATTSALIKAVPIVE